jgi:hypothetical protein
MTITESLFQISDLKDFLEGEWRLERRLDDRHAGQQGILIGKALFAPEGNELLYSEEGRLVIGGHDGPAEQVHRYAFQAPARAQVHFRDGRFFHDLDLAAGRWTATHLCAPDRYDGDFTALGADSWRVVWRVTGPRKDLILDSSYRRAL